jgi:hypothetical protein
LHPRKLVAQAVKIGAVTGIAQKANGMASHWIQTSIALRRIPTRSREYATNRQPGAGARMRYCTAKPRNEWTFAAATLPASTTQTHHCLYMHAIDLRSASPPLPIKTLPTRK